MTPLDLDTIREYCLSHAEEQAALKLLGECRIPSSWPATGNPSRKIIDTARAQMARLRRELRGKLPSAAAMD